MPTHCTISLVPEWLLFYDLLLQTDIRQRQRWKERSATFLWSESLGWFFAFPFYFPEFSKCFIRGAYCCHYSERIKSFLKTILVRRQTQEHFLLCTRVGWWQESLPRLTGWSSKNTPVSIFFFCRVISFQVIFPQQIRMFLMSLICLFNNFTWSYRNK